MTIVNALVGGSWRRRALSTAFAAAAVVVAAAIGYLSSFSGRLGAMSGLNAPLYDASAALLGLSRPEEAWPTTFTLLIDQDTLDRAPWSTAPRALQHPHLADLGRRALDLGARKVALDLVLALDPADLDIAGADLKTYDKPLRDLLASEEGRVIIGAYPTVQPAAAYRDLAGPAGVGVVDLQSEEDGIVRSIATRLRLASGEIAAGFAELVAMPPDDGEFGIREQSRFLLFPRAPLRTAPLLTVAKFEACLRTPDGVERLKAVLAGRNVLIGTGIVGEDLRRGPDRFMTQHAPEPATDPCAPGMLDMDFGERNLVPGVLLQAAAVESAMSPGTPRLASAPQRAIASAVMASLALLLFFSLTRRVTRLPAERPSVFSTSAVAFAGVVGTIAGLGVAFVAVEVLAIRFLQLWLPLGHTLGFVSGLGLLGTMTLAVRRDLALADLRASFGRYLPAKVVAAALQRDEIVDGEERAISVLFADLRSFTQFCNARRHEPTSIIQALNRKFAAVQDILNQYDACLDKFDGDAVIAFWNGVGEQPDHAARAVAAAIEIIENDADMAEEGIEQQLHFKVAVASGLAFVGSYGSKQKMNFSAIGEPMNMAARLEGLCNEYGVSIIIAEDTLNEALGSKGTRRDIRDVLDRHRFECLGRTRIKGYPDPVVIMSVRPEDEASAERPRTCG